MIWQLTAKSGPRRGESWTISDRPLTLGRSLSCEINIEDPTVSRRHAQVYLEGEGAVFRDLGSRNVSLVNGTVVSECRLSLGDELSVGASVFILTRTAAAHASPPEPALESPPSTVSLGKALFASENEAKSSPLYPATSREMVRMFQFGRQLSQAPREEAFASICVQELEELFHRETTAAIWCGGLDNAQCYPASFTAADEVLEQVRFAMASGRPSMARHQKKGRLFQDQLLACVAPMVVTGHCRGALLVTASARRYVLNDGDFARLDALAQAAAPYQIWRDASPTDAVRSHTGSTTGSAGTTARGAHTDRKNAAHYTESEDARIAAMIRDAQIALDAAARDTAADYGAHGALDTAHKYTRRYQDPAMDALEHAEKTLIRAVVSQCGGDIARAAKIFGTTPAALRPLAEELGLIPPVEPTMERE